MYVQRKLSSTSNILRTTLRNSSTGAGLTGLTNASSGLIISTICDNEASATAYSVASSKVETIATLGTFAAPTATKCRFKEVDSTNHPGLYEIQLADARFAVASAKVLRVTISGAANLLAKDIVVQLTAFDLDAAGVDITKIGGSVAAATAIVAFARPVLKAVSAPSGSQYDPFYKYDGDYNGMPSWGGTNEIGALWWDTSSSPYGWTISATKGTQGASFFHRQTTAFDGISPDAPWDDGAADALGNKFIGVGGYNGLTFVLHGTDRTAIDALKTSRNITDTERQINDVPA